MIVKQYQRIQIQILGEFGTTVLTELELKLLHWLLNGQVTLNSDLPPHNFDLPEFANALLTNQNYTNDREILLYVLKVNQVTFHQLH